MDAEPLGSAKTALVVDDQRDFCLMMEQLLGELGLRAVWASDGNEALAKLESEPVDVILTDLFMPGMDGLELIHRLNHSSKRVPPIIAVTGDEHFAAQSVGAAAASLGAQAILIKPFSIHQLASAIGFVCAASARASGDGHPA
jgi:CheY-like chemotaxis protein